MSTLSKYQTLLSITMLIVVVASGQAWAADTNAGYLSYQEPQPASTTSWLSTIGYIFSIIITFAVVLGLAYLTSRFLGQKMRRTSANGDSRILATLVLGPNRTINIVEIAGKVLVLGVTDNSITKLEEITDEARIKRLQEEHHEAEPPAFEKVFQRQLTSLQQISEKFPAVFPNGGSNSKNDNSEKR